jgi:hypothetical protein
MKKLIILFLLPLFNSVAGQQNLKDSVIHTFMIAPSFAYQLPGGDLADRFGNNQNVGVSFSFKTSSNWIYGVEGFFIYGTDVLEPGLFTNISTHQGYVLSTNGVYGDVRTYERGFNINFKAGKLIPMWGPNPNTGLLFTLGAGFLEHNIRIETPNGDVPQLMGDYRKGYDRRTNGVALTEFLGYQFMSNNGKINFFGGFEFVQGFTKNRRTYNFEIMSADNSSRVDLLNGFRVGWIFNIYKRKPNDFYIN